MSATRTRKATTKRANSKGPATRRSRKVLTRLSFTQRGRGDVAATPESDNGYFLLFLIVGVLCAFGLMMVLSASSVTALSAYGNSWFFFKRQVLWLLVGGCVMALALKMDYRVWRKWSVSLVAGATVLLLLVLVPGIGVMIGGSRRWLGPGILRMQPSEIAKFALLVYGCNLFARRGHLMQDWKSTLRPFGFIFVGFAFLVMLQPDMGTTLILGAIAVTLLFVAGTPMRYMARALGLVAGTATVLAVVEPYRRERLLSFLRPFDDAGNSGYQMVQSLVGIGSGGITGVGLGASRAKWGFLPNAHTDFIYAIIAEELGLIGACLIVLLFVALALLGVRTASRSPDRFGMLMASGITAWIVFQAFLNIGAVIGILPVTGVPLPFLSQGGTALVVLMAATGILLNIARQGDEAAANGGPRPSGQERGTGRVNR